MCPVLTSTRVVSYHTKYKFKLARGVSMQFWTPSRKTLVTRLVSPVSCAHVRACRATTKFRPVSNTSNLKWNWKGLVSNNKRTSKETRFELSFGHVDSILYKRTLISISLRTSGSIPGTTTRLCNAVFYVKFTSFDSFQPHLSLVHSKLGITRCLQATQEPLSDHV